MRLVRIAPKHLIVCWRGVFPRNPARGLAYTEKPPRSSHGGFETATLDGLGGLGVRRRLIAKTLRAVFRSGRSRQKVNEQHDNGD